jgi:hypothetical protein
MRVFKLFSRNEEVRTRSNRGNIYHSLPNAKTALRLFVKSVNAKAAKRLEPKHEQLKFEECCIVEYDLVEKDIHRLK